MTTDGSRPLVAYASGAFGPAITSMLYLIVPLRAAELGATVPQIGLVVSCAAVVPAVFAVALGNLVDLAGIKVTFVAGALAVAAFSLCFTAVDSVAGMVPLQAVVGAARSLSWVAIQSYISAFGPTEQRGRHTGRFTFATSLGDMAGPLFIGVMAASVGYRAAFVVVAIYAGVFGVLGMMLSPTGETPVRSDGSRTGFRAAFGLVRQPVMKSVLLLTVCRIWLTCSWQSFFPLSLMRAGHSAAIGGTVVSAAGIAATLTTLTVDRLVKKWSAEVVGPVALLVGAVGMAVSPWCVEMPLPYLPALLLGVSSGVSLPLLIVLIGDDVPAGQRGVAMGMRMSANSAAATGAPSVVGQMIGSLGQAITFPVCGLAACGLIAAARHQSRK